MQELDYKIEAKNGLKFRWDTWFDDALNVFHITFYDHDGYVFYETLSTLWADDALNFVSHILE